MIPLLSVSGLTKHFPVGKGRLLHAVDDVGFSIGAGKSLGLVGESGSGKSTIARLVTRLLPLDGGTLQFEGREIGDIAPKHFARDTARQAVQLVFQNADDALNPAYSAAQSIASRTNDQARVRQMANDVGLAPELLDRRPHQLSGGQQARVGIARALIANPRLLVLDEPTASLDVSVQAAVLKLIDHLRRERSLGLLFVSHDLEVVRLMCDHVLVLYLGRVAEYGPVKDVMSRPAHPYTRALVAATPGRITAQPLTGEPVSPIDPPENACLFHSRCPIATPRCRTERPNARTIAPGWQVACHHAEQVSVAS